MNHRVLLKPRLIVIAAVVGVFSWVFAGALFGSGMFVFRDGAHFYYPLFRLIAGEWAAGRVPLWNPYENLGMPLAGNAPSSVFYPGKLIFALPIGFDWSYKLYVMGHVLLAVWGMYRLARAWRASVEAAGVAAISYAFSGNILYQYCNVIFLVGAAWMPLAVLAAHRMLAGRSLRWAVVFGAVLALITLGGDPQTAYHAGLLAALYAACLWFSRGSRNSPRLRFGLVWSTALLCLAGLVGMALSAVQVLPSAEFTRASGREASGAPRSLYELPIGLAASVERPAASSTPLAGREDASPGVPLASQEERSSRRSVTSTLDGLLCRIEPGTHHEQVYHFSVGPWRLAEYLWPNFSGRQFPVNRRWLEIIPAEGRIWAPSLYMGVIPLLLALWSLRWRSRKKGAEEEGTGTSLRSEPVPFSSERLSWLSWFVVLSIVGSFGWFGLGWLVREFQVIFGRSRGAELVGPPFGGVYWLMTVVLPGYVYFRYPAKLLAVAALGLSLLAARGWDRAFAAPAVGLRRLLAGLAVAGLLGGAVVLAIRPCWQGWMAGIAPNGLFGPLDASGAFGDLVLSLVQSGTICALFWWLLGRQTCARSWASAAGMILVAVDLAVANGWMVVCGPADQWSTSPALASLIDDDRYSRADAEPYRVYRRPVWSPSRYACSGSPTRLADAMQWDRDTLWPKYHLAAGVSLAEVYGTMMPADYQAFLETTRRPLPGCEGWLPDLAALGAVNAKYLILRGGDRPAGMERVGPANAAVDQLPDVSLWHNPGALPRAWIVHRTESFAPRAARDCGEVRGRSVEAFCPQGRPRDLRDVAVVEGQVPPIPHAFLSVRDDPEEQRGVRETHHHASSPAQSEELCRIAHYDPLRVEIEAQLDRPGMVVLSDQFYPGWHLTVQTAREEAREAPILRTNRVMRGVWLPAGRHRLIYQYRPASFAWGVAISGIGWMGLLLFGAAVILSACFRRGRASKSFRRLSRWETGACSSRRIG